MGFANDRVGIFPTLPELKTQVESSGMLLEFQIAVKPAVSAFHLEFRAIVVVPNRLKLAFLASGGVAGFSMRIAELSSSHAPPFA
ncbi:MAG: hypothetical protein V4819_02385 [Verrucomicrobiota bacterium]